MSAAITAAATKLIWVGSVQCGHEKTAVALAPAVRMVACEDGFSVTRAREAFRTFADRFAGNRCRGKGIGAIGRLRPAGNGA